MSNQWTQEEKDQRIAELDSERWEKSEQLLRLVRRLTRTERAYTNAYRELQEFMANMESPHDG